MKANEIISALTKKGYSVTVRPVVKNGVEFTGLTIDTGVNIKPTVYLEQFTGNDRTPEEVAAEIINVIEANKPAEDMQVNINKDYIYQHCFLAMQKESEEDLVKKPGLFEGTEVYISVEVPVGCFKLKTSIAENFNIDTEAVFLLAEEHTGKSATINRINDLVPIPEEVCEELDIKLDYFDCWLVVSNPHCFRGSGAIACKSVQERAKEMLHTDKVIVIPSSVNEVIVLPYVDNIQERVDEMINTVNETEVAPEEILSYTSIVL